MLRYKHLKLSVRRCSSDTHRIEHRLHPCGVPGGAGGLNSWAAENKKSIRLEWKEIAGARSYELLIQTSGGSKVTQTSLETTQWKGDLPPRDPTNIRFAHSTDLSAPEYGHLSKV